jgi:transcriptional regulator with XRE-family HTH domain
LVAASAQLNLKLTWNPPQALGRLAREAKCPDAAAIGRRLNTSKVTIWYWLRGRARPNLASSLGYHYAFGASLAKTLGASAPPELHAAQPEMHLSGRKKSVRRDWGDVKRVLEAELASPACRSLRQLSGVLQTPVRTLRAHFPDLCRRIADARRAQQRGALDQSDTLLVTKLTRAKNELECALTAPTPANLEKHLSVPGLLNRRGPRRALRALGHA